MRGPLDKGKLCIVSPSARRVHLTLSMINFFAKFGYEVRFEREKRGVWCFASMDQPQYGPTMTNTQR